MKYFGLLFFAFILIFSSCIKDVEYKLDFEGSKMVVIAGGQANHHLTAFVTKTFPPLTEVQNPDSLLINDAIIEIYKSGNVIDTMKNSGDGNYVSGILLEEGGVYNLTVKKPGWHDMKSTADTVAVAAKLLDAEIVKTWERKDTTYSYSIKIDLKILIEKSSAFPYNDITFYYYANGQEYEDYLFLSSKSDFIECDNCFNLLDNACVEKTDDNKYILETDKTIYVPEFKLEELDSIKIVLGTYSSISEKMCQSGMDLEEYYGNPLPFVSNPPADFSNIEGGYGIFILSNQDSLIVKLK